MRGTMTVEIARVKQGKTEDALRVAYLLARAGSRVTVVAPELSLAQARDRLLLLHTQHSKPGNQPQTPQDSLSQALNAAGGACRFVTAQSLPELETHLTDDFSHGGTSFPVLVMDGLFSQDIFQQCTAIKRLALEHQCFVFLTLQRPQSGNLPQQILALADQVYMKEKCR
jgi:hypothetical protein